MVHIDTSNGVLTVTFDEPERRNALGVADYTRLAGALSTAAKDPTLRAVLIRATGTVFCAGNRLDEFETEWPQPDDGPVLRFFTALAAAPVPVIAAVQGGAVGVGATLLLHCDLVLCSDAAFLKFPFVPLGIAPEGASSRLLPERLGISRAMDILLTGRKVEAGEIDALGLGIKVGDGEALEQRAGDWLKRFAELPADAVRTTKALIRRPLEADINERFDVEIRAINGLLEQQRKTT
ncbi:enoyl-CoA hydratase/isomerase family protein [Alloalcanivorax mobilis]|uniref:enoyl-CoA hydratase/isomerase family protein n=1 Tax=Alloalcanivorax mobilis TaxID=2019569 RepID=UPI000C78C9DD|nr:enoyl-CoA hydratase-related protein [Alloalcanivorax mobilis]